MQALLLSKDWRVESASMQKAEKVIGLTWLVYLLRNAILCCLLCSVWKLLLQVSCPVFYLFIVGRQLSTCYFIRVFF